MRILQNPDSFQRAVQTARRKGKSVGFVPTMGALHEGHLSLIRAARRENDVVAVSIFVNPIQFNQPKDLRSYPRTLAKDARLASEAGADLIFAPSAAAIYPPDFQTFIEVSRVSRPLEGRFRPGHFRGVATIVTKLFNLAQPDRAYFGQKDAQQARVVQQLIRDLNFPVALRVLPTVREQDGLAMSSRNSRLSTEQRRAARALFTALQAGRRLIECGHRREIVVVRRIKKVLQGIRGMKVDYAAVVDLETFDPVRTIQRRVLLLVACRLGDIRLIDNMQAVPRRRAGIGRSARAKG